MAPALTVAPSAVLDEARGFSIRERLACWMHVHPDMFVHADWYQELWGTLLTIINDRVPVAVLNELARGINGSGIYMVCESAFPLAWYDGEWHVTTYELPTLAQEALREEIRAILSR